MLETVLLAVLGSSEPVVNNFNERSAVESVWHLPSTVEVGEKEYTGGSLYRGEHFSSRHEDNRRCIRHRESRGHYHAVGATGTFRGAYQFSPGLRTGAGWMIQKDLRENNVPKRVAKRIGKSLRKTPMNKWHPFWQDYAFWIVWDHGNGKSHWTHQVPGTACF